MLKLQVSIVQPEVGGDTEKWTPQTSLPIWSLPLEILYLIKMRELFSNVFWKPTFNVLKAIWSSIYCLFESGVFFFLFKNRISSSELFVYLYIQSVEKMFLKMSTLFHLWLELRVK